MIYLTNRDHRFLHDLYTIKYLNTKRIFKLFGNYGSSMRRLKQLRDENYIHIIDYINNRELVYTVSKKYCISINQSWEGFVKTDKLLHYLACADYYFYVRDQIKNIYFEKVYKFSGGTFRPDIVYQTTSNKWIFVEIDLSNRRFEDKVKTWELYYTTQAFKQHFAKFPPIIIVSTNPDKVRNIIEKAQKIKLNYIYKSMDEVSNWSYKY